GEREDKPAAEVRRQPRQSSYKAYGTGPGSRVGPQHANNRQSTQRNWTMKLGWQGARLYRLAPSGGLPEVARRRRGLATLRRPGGSEVREGPGSADRGALEDG